MGLIVISQEELRAIMREELKNSFLEHQQNYSNQPQEEVLDINEAVSLVKLRKQTIYSLTCKGRIPHFKRSKILYFKKTELMEWLEERRKNQQKYDVTIE